MTDKAERRKFLKAALAALATATGMSAMPQLSAQDVIATRRLLRRQRKLSVNKPPNIPLEVPNTTTAFTPELPVNKVVNTKLYDSVSLSEEIQQFGQPKEPDSPVSLFWNTGKRDVLIERLKKLGIEEPPPAPIPGAMCYF